MNYSAEVLVHYRNPRNAGTLDPQLPDVGTGQAGSREQGAVVRLQIKVEDDGRIGQARFKAYGCGCTIAAASLATEWLQGADLDKAAGLNSAAFVEALSLPPVKMYCAMLAEDAIQAAIDDYRNKQQE